MTFDIVILSILIVNVKLQLECFPEAKDQIIVDSLRILNMLASFYQACSSLQKLISWYIFLSTFYPTISTTFSPLQKYNKKLDIKNSCENFNSQKVFFLICRNLLNPFRSVGDNQFFLKSQNQYSSDHNHWFCIFSFSKLECPSSVLRMLKYSLSVWVREFDEG